MSPEEFESILTRLCERLTTVIVRHGIFSSSPAFERQAREELERLLRDSGFSINFSPHPHVFPDISLKRQAFKQEDSCFFGAGGQSPPP
jgi:hypothetical protein